MKTPTELAAHLRKHARIADRAGWPHVNLLHEAADMIEALAASQQEPVDPVQNDAPIIPQPQPGHIA